MNVSLPPPETIHVHFPHFLLSAFAAWKVAVFARKSYALRPQEICFSPARAMVLEPKSTFLAGQNLWSWRPTAPSDEGKSGWGGPAL